MRRSLFTLSAATIASAHPLRAQSPRPSAATIVSAVDSLAQRVVSLGVSPGLGVALVMDGKTVLAKSYGMLDVTQRVPASNDALWYVASTSKSFTGFATALLAQQKRLSLAAPISELLPGVQWATGVDPSALPLTRFLSHTSYIADNAVVQSAAFTNAIPESRWPELLRFELPSGNTDLVYTNFGYNVAAMVIDRIRPEGWRRYLDSAVYRPAGLTQTYTRISGIDSRRIAKPHATDANGYRTVSFEKTDTTMNSAGGHLSTMHDLARWVTVQMDSGRIDGRQVFPAAAVALSHELIAKHTVASSRKFGPFDREGWAAGWDIGAYKGERMVSRFGSYSSFRSHLSMLPARSIGFVAVVNGPIASGATDILAALAYDLEAGRPYARDSAAQKLDALAARLPVARAALAANDSVRRARQRPTRHPMMLFVGRYVSDAMGEISFSELDGALHFRWGVLEGPVEVFDADKDILRFEIAGNGNTAAFAFDASGPATSVKVSGAVFLRR